MNIVKLCLFVFIGLIMFTSCNSEDDDSKVQFESTATISGYDMSKCGCCGGWLIDINDEETNKRFTELPKNSNIDLQKSTFPLRVQLNWSESDEYCGKGITIESIELAD